MKRLSIRWQLTLWYSVALGAILCCFCVVLLILMRRQILARTDAGLREEVKEVRLEIDLADSATKFRSQADARFSPHDFYEFLVTDETGRVVFSSSAQTSVIDAQKSLFAASPDIQISSQEIAGQGPFRIATASHQSPIGQFEIRVMRSLAPIYADLNSIQLLMAALLPLGVALAVAAGYFLAGRSLRPVQQVVNDANAIDISCLDRRIEVPNPHDEIGRLAAALNSLIERLERAVTEIRRFTADASHEIRTPIASLRSEAESALLQTRSTAEYQQTLSVVVEETTRLGRLADQLLNLSRHDAGIAQQTQEPTPLDALLQDITDHLQRFARERDVTLDCDCREVCEVLGDDVRLSQAFFNLIENAIKYTSAEGEVQVKLDHSAEIAIVEISDNGIGIPVKDIPHVFERFYRVDSGRTHGRGAGLGLSIAKSAIDSHEGTITIESQPGQGTRVIVRLPLNVASPLQASRARETIDA